MVAQFFFLLFASFFFLFVVQPIQCGPQISGLPPTASATADDADQQHQRHAFSALEPELAENIFNREGAAKNPLRRTTTMPLTDRLDIGHNAGSNVGQQRNSNGEKLSGIVRQQSPPPRMPRSLPRRSEYDTLNEDFISEYDALNLDFNLDDDAGKEAKELEVAAREFSWQEGEGGQKSNEPEFPPKEWWDGEEVEEKKEEPKKEERPKLKASKMVEVAKKEEQKEVPRRRGSPIQQPILIVDLPQRNKVHGKRRSNRARRGARVEGVARLDGWPTGSRPFGSIDREELRIVPKLVPSYPPPTTTTPISTLTTKMATPVQNSLTTKKPLNVGQRKGGHEFVQSPRLPAKKQQQFLSTQQEFFHDLPSGRDEASAAFAEKRTILLHPIQQPQSNPPLQQQFVPSNVHHQIVPSHQIESNQFRPFPAGQPQPFQPVLNLGASTSPLDAFQQQAQQSQGRPHNHGQSSPAGRLLPTGFMHIATLESPPQQDGNNQIIIDGKRFWVERTVPLSQFFPPPNNNQTLANGQQAKEPAEELPTLLEMPHLQEPPQPNEQQNRQFNAQNVENGNSAGAGVVEERREQFSSNKSPPLRGSRIANSARVYSLADNEPPLWTGGQQSPQNHQFNQQIGGNGEFGGGNAPNGGGKRRGIGKGGNNLLALNLGTALSQIFGNFTIEHDAKLVERKPEPMELSFPGAQPNPAIEEGSRGNQANSEPHRLTRFFERPQPHLHGN